MQVPLADALAPAGLSHFFRWPPASAQSEFSWQQSGAWQLEVLRSDAAGRTLETRRCSFDLH